MTDVLDHTSGSTGLTLTITASKDGGIFSSITPTVTERGNGWYNLALTTSHTDTLGDLALHIEATGADDTDLLCRVVAGELDADISSRLATSGYTAPDNTGIAAIPTNPLLTDDSRLDNLDATISSRSTLTVNDIPEVDNSAIATAVRSELATELARIDADITSRLANADYTIPDNDNIDFLRKITGNKITKEGSVLTIYENDGNTIWRRYDISSGGRVEV